MEEVTVVPPYSAPNTPAPSSQVCLFSPAYLLLPSRRALTLFEQEAMAVDDATATPTQASVREDAKAASKSAPTTVSRG